jgi:hypothetical protein
MVWLFFFSSRQQLDIIYNILALRLDCFAWQFFSSFCILWLLCISSYITNWGVTSFMHNCTSEYLISLCYWSAGKSELCQGHSMIRWDISVVTLLLTVIFTALILKEYAYLITLFSTNKNCFLWHICCLSYSYITPISSFMPLLCYIDFPY